MKKDLGTYQLRPISYEHLDPIHPSLLEDARFTVYEDEREEIITFVSASGL